VKTGVKVDRRSQTRFPQNLRISITELPLLGAEGRRKRGGTVTGHIHNISRGGMCVITTGPLSDASIVRCEIAIGEDSVRVSTLTQVRWTQPEKLHSDRFISGLAFLI
jgi:hypothetical protein